MDKKEEEILQNTEGYQQYEESFIVGQYECDCNGRIKAGALMSQCQAISTNHCNSIGMTIDVYHKTHTVFLLAKASLEIYGEIRVGDKIRMVTRPSSPNRAVYSRYTRFFNEQGQEVAAQDSKWVLVDTDTRKILRNPPEEMHFPFNLPISHTLVGFFPFLVVSGFNLLSLNATFKSSSEYGTLTESKSK